MYSLFLINSSNKLFFSFFKTFEIFKSDNMGDIRFFLVIYKSLYQISDRHITNANHRTKNKQINVHRTENSPKEAT